MNKIESKIASTIEKYLKDLVGKEGYLTFEGKNQEGVQIISVDIYPNSIDNMELYDGDEHELTIKGSVTIWLSTNGIIKKVLLIFRNLSISIKYANDKKEFDLIKLSNFLLEKSPIF